MKVLFLAPYAPFPPRGGGEQRMYQMLRQVAERHDVDLLTFVADDATAAALEPLRALCRVHMVPTPAHRAARRVRTLLTSGTPDMVLRGQDDAFAHALEDLLQAERFDVVQSESIEMAQYGRHRAGPLWVYDAFNAEYQIQRRAFRTDVRRARRLPVAAYSFVQWMKLQAYERGLARRFDLAFAVSEADQRELRRLAPTLRTAVVPNGVDTTFFQPTSLPPIESPSLLFTGTLDYRPNVDAITWFVTHVWPRLHERRTNLRLRIVGQRPTPAVQELGRVDGVEVVGPVADVRPWFAGATAYVLPMRVGGGVRLKLLETWSMGVPCVTTTMGAAGVDGFEAGRHAIVGDDAAAFAAAVERLLDDPSARAMLAQNARALVEDQYDWRPIVERMMALWACARGTTDERRTTNDGQLA